MLFKEKNRQHMAMVSRQLASWSTLSHAPDCENESVKRTYVEGVFKRTNENHSTLCRILAHFKLHFSQKSVHRSCSCMTFTVSTGTVHVITVREYCEIEPSWFTESTITMPYSECFTGLNTILSYGYNIMACL